MSSLGKPPEVMGQDSMEIAIVLAKLRDQQRELERKVRALEQLVQRQVKEAAEDSPLD
jgi:hypothetical protein